MKLISTNQGESLNLGFFYIRSEKVLLILSMLTSKNSKRGAILLQMTFNFCQCVKM